MSAGPDREAEAWRSLPPAAYDRTICAMLEAAEGTDAMLALASIALRRSGATLTESRVCCIEQLLAVIPSIAEPVLQSRIRVLLLLAWLQLGAVAARVPESIARAPELPPGVTLPDGADPAAIHDPVLREQALEAAARHTELVEQWNASQRAIGHLRHFAVRLRLALPSQEWKELAAAMSLAPGVPPELRASLENEAQ